MIENELIAEAKRYRQSLMTRGAQREARVVGRVVQLLKRKLLKHQRLVQTCHEDQPMARESRETL
jgi:hypothetical protein